MSKKKSFSGSTMSLKDFHGGTIPSDLQLPSAPGAITRHSDRSSSWGNPACRSDHRFRALSSGIMHGFDEKASIFSSHPHLGRNYDEDERKPLDGISAPRRTISDEAASAARLLPQNLSDAKVGAGKISMPQSQISVPARAKHSVTAPSANPGLNGAAPNAWVARKEVTRVPDPTSSSTLGGSTAVLKFAQASALEKIQSGRWQSRPTPCSHPDVEVIRSSDSVHETLYREKNVNEDVNHYKGSSQVNDSIAGYANGVKEIINYEGASAPFYSLDDAESTLAWKKVALDYQQQLQTCELPEKPTMKLFLSTKPLENFEMQNSDQKHGHLASGVPGHVEAFSKMHISSHSVKGGATGAEGADERPKLNLKPRSRLLEHVDESAERERISLFGGGRPREEVLKERGVDDTMFNNIDASHHRVNRGRTAEFTIAETPAPLSARYGGRCEVSPSATCYTRDSERRDKRPDPENYNVQRNSWQSEWKNGSEAEMQLEQNHPPPQHWRTPAEPLPKLQPETSRLSHARAVSAVELAQAFSRPVLYSRATDRVATHM